jgi:dethiobiotin synthetase
MEMFGLFVTATDTGAGKTTIACAIARQWRRQGRTFRVCKPVATGAKPHRDRLVSDDTLALARAAVENDLDAVTPFAFEAEAAPPVAARLARSELTLDSLVGSVRRLSGEGAILVEGVGGLLCPLTEKETVADLVAGLGLPLLVVAKRSLGTLNHTLLTLEVARRRGLLVAGLVVNETTPVSGIAEETNVEELLRRVEAPLLAVVPNHPATLQEEIPAVSAVDWWSLMG